jgi:integrase/recombinase XerD
MNTQNLLKEKMQKGNYGARTINAYQTVIKKITEYYPNKDIRSLVDAEIKTFLKHKAQEGFSSRTLSLYVNALNFLYREVYQDPGFKALGHPKRQKKYPVILTPLEISQLLSSVINLKHKILLASAFGMGLGVSEVVDLKVGDVSFVDKKLFIKGDKSKNDRQISISENLINPLKRIIGGKSEQDYVFESEKGGGLTVRSAQKIFEKALSKSEIKKKASFYSLRHSFAFYLVQKGLAITVVQEILGHKNIRTTQIYKQLSRQEV